MDLGLSRRVALVTGSSRGIGRCIAERLACEGARVAITYRHRREQAEEFADSLVSSGGDALAVHLDLAARESIRSAVSVIATRWGSVDVLVNSAVEWVSMPPHKFAAFETTSVAEWQHPLHVNVDGVYATIQEVVGGMRANGWGRIVTLSSIAADDGMVGYAWYAMAKAALHGLTRTLARELGPEGILVNAVMPGATSTDSVKMQVSPGFLERQARALPIRRLPRPEEVAAVVVFLASSANAVLTGEIVRASGGRP